MSGFIGSSLHKNGLVNHFTSRGIDDNATSNAVTIDSSENVTITDGAHDFDVASHDTSNGLKLGGTLVSATATELNIMDGVTASTAELNKMDGVTVSTAQINAPTTLGTVTSGNLSNTAIVYPAGHVIKTSSIQAEDVGEISTTSATLEDSGLVVAHTTVASSTNSYLTFEAYSGMGYIGTVNKRGLLDVCVTSDSATAYNADDSICNSTYPWFLMCRGLAPWYVPLYFKGVCGLETGMGMPADIASWNAGDTLYFRMFDAVDGGDFRFCHGNTCYSVTVKEVAR